MGADDNPWRTVAAVVIAVLGFACAVLAGVLFWWLWRRRRGAAYRAEVPRDAASPKDQLALTIKNPGEQLNNNHNNSGSNHAAAAGSAAAATPGALIAAAVTPGGAAGDPATPAMAKMTAAAGVGKSTRDLAAAAMVLLNDASGEQSRSSAGPGGVQVLRGSLHAAGGSLHAAGGLVNPQFGAAGGSIASPAHSAKLMKVQALAEEMAGPTGSDVSERLTLLQPIAKGGFGQVYKGKWRNLDVAVKTVLFSEANGSTEQRALREAAVCSSIVHPNVVCTYHVDIAPVKSENSRNLLVEHASPRTDGNDFKLYLVQELCSVTLRAVLYDGLLHGKNGSADMDPVLTLLADVARGLEFIHSKHIIHGDLKPENVLLRVDTTSPIGVVAKVSDFGLSHAIAPHASHLSNIKGGTPFYQAPETVRKRMLTKASDVYSFGVLMWEIYNQVPPWIKKPQGGYSYAKHFGKFSSSAPAPFTRLCRRCLDPGPRNRPTSKEILAELEAQLAAYLDGFDDLVNPNLAAAEGGKGDIYPSSTGKLTQGSTSMAMLALPHSVSMAGHVGGPSTSPSAARLAPHAPAPGSGPAAQHATDWPRQTSASVLPRLPASAAVAVTRGQPRLSTGGGGLVHPYPAGPTAVVGKMNANPTHPRARPSRAAISIHSATDDDHAAQAAGAAPAGATPGDKAQVLLVASGADGEQQRRSALAGARDQGRMSASGAAAGEALQAPAPAWTASAAAQQSAQQEYQLQHPPGRRVSFGGGIKDAGSARSAGGSGGSGAPGHLPSRFAAQAAPLGSKGEGMRSSSLPRKESSAAAQAGAPGTENPSTTSN